MSEHLKNQLYLKNRSLKNIAAAILIITVMGDDVYVIKEINYIPENIIDKTNFFILLSFPKHILVNEHTKYVGNSEVDEVCDCESKINYNLPCTRLIRSRKDIIIGSGLNIEDYDTGWFISFNNFSICISENYKNIKKRTKI